MENIKNHEPIFLLTSVILRNWGIGELAEKILPIKKISSHIDSVCIGCILQLDENVRTYRIFVRPYYSYFGACNI